MAAAGFSSMSVLSQPTLEVIQQLGFATPTPVQQAVLPVFTGNQDVAVEACTGSGKTLAFVIPVTERLRKLEEPLSLYQASLLVADVQAKHTGVTCVPFARSEPSLYLPLGSLLGKSTMWLSLF